MVAPVPEIRMLIIDPRGEVERLPNVQSYRPVRELNNMQINGSSMIPHIPAQALHSVEVTAHIHLVALRLSLHPRSQLPDFPPDTSLEKTE
jgi:hypothetical protein